MHSFNELNFKLITKFTFNKISIINYNNEDIFKNKIKRKKKN